MKQQITNPVIIGKIGVSYGIKGWVKIFSFTEKKENIFIYQPWFIKNFMKYQLIKIENWRYHNHNLIIKIKDFNDRNAVNIINHCNIIVESSQLPELEDGTYYWKDLMACKIVTTSGYKLGKIIDIIETGSNDVMVVKINPQDKSGLKKHLIPFITGQVIKKVSLATNIIEVDWDPNF